MKSTDECACGTGEPYGKCCFPLHAGDRQAATAEQLMRSRYSATAVGEYDYVWRTWHPATRPPDLSPRDGITWTGLEVMEAVAGTAEDEIGEVEFCAHFVQAGRTGTLQERSRFVVRARRWFYLDGDVIANSGS